MHLKNFIKRYPALELIARKSCILIESIIFGGCLRERILLKVLNLLYQSKKRRQWMYADHPPHFYNHRDTGFNFTFSATVHPYFFFRGFYNAEIVKENDRILDIGCGDGFFANRFLASKSSWVDAIDIEKSAIYTASKHNRNPKIKYYIIDAVKEDFPGRAYDLITWDGAIGHFTADNCKIVLNKIKRALNNDGVFSGSESLGHEGHDHLQFFQNESDLADLFKPYFKRIFIRSISYNLAHPNEKFVRREAYWRCSNSHRLNLSTAWYEFNAS